MKAAGRRESTERILTLPQICCDFSIRVGAGENNTDWQDGYKECIENSELVYDYVIEIAQKLGCDGLRMGSVQNISHIYFSRSGGRQGFAAEGAKP